MKLLIRKATEDDLELLSAIAYEHDVYQSAYTDAWNEEFSITKDWKKIVLQEIKSRKNFVLIFFLGTAIVGAARINVHQLKSRVRSKVLEVKTLFIYEKFRGQNIGSQVMEYIMNYAKENHFERLRVESLINNEEATKFYKKHGFKEFSIGLEKDI